MPTVSVVVPTYNRAGRIHRSIESVLAQTHEDLELIVVDDGSTDYTEEVVRSYDDDRLTYVAHEDNRGASAARNTGIERASGEYVAFLDSDDAWLPRKLERQVAVLESRPPEWVAVYCGVEIGDDAGPLRRFARWAGLTRLSQTEGAEGGVELVKDVLMDRLHTSAGSTLLVSADVVDAVDGFDESFERFQDPEFLIRVLRQGKLAYVDETLVRRYDTGRPPASVVEQSDRRYLAKFADTVERLEREGYDVRGIHHRFLAKFYFQDGEFRAALRHARRASVPGPRQYPGLIQAVLDGVKPSRS
ncbi:glycosyltransferase family 2 protein [Halobacterium yunchengense]|uniref:glycosyltransferase family 2 protein n=1 Tax=Halobacterium yunchengense TaxID=3108497 RepID=UPI00300B1A38